MIQSELRDILVTLLKKSEAGQVKWLNAKSAGMKSPISEDFVLLMPNSAINVFRAADGFVRVNILDGEGETITYATSEGDLNDNTLLENLLSSARRKAMGIDKTLEDIKNLISKDGVVGETKPRKFNDDDDIPY